jgi:hypothetical protein
MAEPSGDATGGKTPLAKIGIGVQNYQVCSTIHILPAAGSLLFHLKIAERGVLKNFLR